MSLLIDNDWLLITEVEEAGPSCEVPLWATMLMVINSKVCPLAHGTNTQRTLCFLVAVSSDYVHTLN